MEGMLSARAHPNNIFWNVTRFHPFYCLLEARALLQPLHRSGVA